MSAPAKQAPHTPDQLTAVVRSIDPGCKVSERRVLFLNPTRDDKNRGSCSMELDTGLFYDHADKKFKGCGPAALLMLAKGIDRTAAGKELASILQGHVVPLQPHAAPPASPAMRMLAAPKGTPGPKMPLQGFEQTGSWVYLNAAGCPQYWVARYDPHNLGVRKEYRPFHWDGNRHVVGDPKGVLLPLFNLDQLAAKPDATVLVCEGEKAAVAAQKLFPRFVCTTSPHGAPNAAMSDWSPLAGHDVIVFPDNDTPGQGYAQDVARLAYAAGAASAAIVPVPPSFPEGWDLADTLPDGEDLKALLKSAVLVPKPKKLIDFVMSLGDFMAQDIPPRDYLVFPWLQTSSLNMVFAKRGLGKTFFWVIRQTVG